MKVRIGVALATALCLSTILWGLSGGEGDPWVPPTPPPPEDNQAECASG